MSDWAKGCGLKRAFATLADVDAFMARRKIQGMHGYRCSHCDHFHLGHSKYTREEGEDAPFYQRSKPR